MIHSHVKNFSSEGEHQHIKTGTNTYLCSLGSEILRGTIEVVSGITKGGWPVVVEQTGPPDVPGGSVSELGDGTVEKRDGSAAVIVIGHPQHSLINPVILGVHETPANLI